LGSGDNRVDWEQEILGCFMGADMTQVISKAARKPKDSNHYAR